MMLKRVPWSILAAVAITAASSIWKFVLPDVLKLPPKLELPVFFVTGAVVVTAGASWAWRWINARVPRPWFPNPIWRIGSWLRFRPSVMIITATPTIQAAGDRILECEIGLIVQRNLARMPSRATLAFDDAKLVLRQTRGERRVTYVFRPRETGGFLGMELPPHHNDNVTIKFAGTAFPMFASDAPDFGGDYELDLTGVKARVKLGAGLSGELPAVNWVWFNQIGREATAGAAIQM